MAARNYMQDFKDHVCAWYPEYKTKTYFVPPVIITRIPFVKETLAGQDALMPQCLSAQVALKQHATSQSNVMQNTQTLRTPSTSQQTQQTVNTLQSIAGSMWKAVPNFAQVQESDQRDDLAQQQVLFCLRELAREQNEVMFVLSQLDFLDYLGNPCYANQVRQLRLPGIIKSKGKPQKGDFDLLLIHRSFGLIVGEIKAVNSNHQLLNKSQQDADRDTLKEFRKQLNS